MQVLFAMLLAFCSFGTLNSDLSTFLSLKENPETVVITCGTDPDGNDRCVRTEYDDGSDCLIVDNEGAPGGIAYYGCDEQ